MEWAQILVIILSVFLVLFLLVGIILGILFIKITRQIRMVTGAAERTVNMIEKTVASARGAAVPFVIAKAVSALIKKRSGGKDHGRNRK
jgi:hypothetical protein